MQLTHSNSSISTQHLPQLLLLLLQTSALSNLTTAPTTLKLARYGGNTDAKFKLGKWGFPVNILALVWSTFMVINVSWPRTATYGLEWYHQYAAWMYTAVLIVLGVFIYYYKLIKKQRIS